METTRGQLTNFLMKSPENAVRVGRPSKWGNKNKVATEKNPPDGVEYFTRAEALVRYRRDLLNNPTLLNQIEALRGKVLLCSCKPGEACHADILIEFLNNRK